MATISVDELPPEARELGKYYSATNDKEQNHAMLWVGFAFSMAIAAATAPFWLTITPGDESLIWLISLGTAGFFSLLGVVFAVLSLLSERHQYFLFERGIVRHAKGTSQIIPWGDIQKLDVLEMQESRFGKPTIYATITLEENKKLSLSSKYAGAMPVIQALQENVPNATFRQASLG